MQSADEKSAGTIDGVFYPPDVGNVPIEEVIERGAVMTRDDNRTIDGVVKAPANGWDTANRARAQEVREQEDGCPAKQPEDFTKGAAPLRFGLVFCLHRR